MASQDQIEIINSHGEIRFHTLGGSGITNIGRHPDNDIVIESPVVAPFHAVLDHQQKPFRLVALNNSAGPIKVSGQVLQPNSPFILHNWDTIELDGHSLVVMESGAASGGQAPVIAPAPLPVPIPPVEPPVSGVGPVAGSASLAAGAGDIPSDIPDLDELDRLLSSLPEDRSDDVIIVNPIAQNGAIDPSHPSALDFQADVEQSATMQINVRNGGEFVGEFVCEVRGLDPSWVTIAPAVINLNDGGEGSFTVAVTAPRHPSSRAKAYYFSIVVTSPNYPGRMNSIGALLVLNPFYNYAVGDVDPRKQNISFTKRMGKAVIPIINLGNSPATYQVTGEDERHAATIEFDSPEQGLKLVGQMQAVVPPEQTMAVPIFVTPRKRHVVGFGGQDISYTVTVTPVNGDQTTPRSVLASARNMPLIGPIPIFLLVLALLLGVVWLLTPRIDEFTVDKTVTSTGDTFTLSWKTSPFTSLHIDPLVGKVDGPSGSKSLTAADPNITYTLVAETFLTPLYPPWFTAKKDVTLVVNPVLPVIRTFASTAKTANIGDSVTISWAVDKADRLILNINGAPETIPPEQMTGSRTFTMESATTFNLQAFNADAPNGISQSLVVDAVIPTPTAYPPPAIKSFLVEPQTITLGDEVTLTWEVTGVDKVKISGIENELPAKGSLTVRPTTNASYVLEAVTPDGQKTNSAVYNVTVNTPPTPTPVPGPPVIEYFKISPAEVAVGTADAKNIQLSWKVTGGITNIQITDPSGKSSGLAPEGTLTVSADKTTIFVLTAFNGALTASQTVQVKVKNPVPKITSLNPTSTSNVGGGSFVITVNGSGFVKESKVQWAGTNRTTIYVSPTQLTATILPEDITAAGVFDVKVTNATPGGGTSGSVQFTVNNPVPTITSITPGTVTKGLSSLTLYVNGTNFVAGPNGQNGSAINFNGADLATVFISNTQLSAQLSTGQLSTPGSYGVKVTNPTPGGGSATASDPFVINPSNLVPTISSLSPSTFYVGSDTQTLTVNGTLFVPGSLVKWKGIILPAPTGQIAYQSDTEMVVVVTADKLTTVGTVPIRAYNPSPGGGDSAPTSISVVALPISFSLTSSTVQINQAVIASVTVGAVQANDVALSISGVPGGYVSFYPKTDVDCTSLVAGPIIIPAGASSAQFCVRGDSDSSSFPGGITITTTLPSSLGGQSDSDNLTIISDPPTISAVNPVDSKYQGCAAPGTGVGNSNLQLSIDGTHFVSQSRVYISTNGGGTYTQITNAPIVNVGGTNLTVNVPASFADVVRTLQVQVRTGTYQTSSLPFNILGPTLSSTISCPVTGAGLTPTTIGAGAADFTLTVKGENFVQGSTIYWNGAAQSTTFTDHNTLTTVIPADSIQFPGSIPVLVKNPNSSSNQTAAINFAITAPTLTLSPGSAALSVGTSQTMTVSLSTSQSVARTVLLSFDSGHTGIATITDCSGNTITVVTLVASSTPSGTFCLVGATNTTTAGTLTASVQSMSASTDSSSVTVSLAPVTVALSITSPTVSGTEPYTGESVSLHATVTASNPAAGVPTGTITFKDGATNLTCSGGNPVTLVSGTADCLTTFNSNNLISHGLTAVYTASGVFQNSTSSTVPLTVQKAPTTTTYGLPATIFYGTSVSFAVTVLDTTNGSPTGSVSMSDNGTAIAGATGTLSSGAANLTPSGFINAGTHPITATYAGDNNFASSTSGSQDFVVNKALVNNSVSASSNNLYYGQSVTLTATITNTSTGVTPTGTIDFKSDGTSISGCNARTLSGSGTTATATCTTTAPGLIIATHVITATYDNTDGNFDDATNATSTLSGGLKVKSASTSLSLGTSLTPSIYGQSVTFTATVTNSVSSATPTGTVAFSGGTPTLACNATLSGSGNTATATCVSSTLQPGTGITITATYTNSDGNFDDSTNNSDTVSQTVKASTSISVTTSGSPSQSGASVTFTGTVSNTAPAGGTPTGTLNFRSDGTTITGCGARALNGSGVATCSTSALGTGTHTITAIYTATGNFEDGNTGTLSGGQTVINLTLTAPGSSTIQVGGGASAASRSQFTAALVGTTAAQSLSLSASDGTVLKFTDCSSTTQITTVTTSGGATNNVTFCAVGVKAGTSTITVTYAATGETETSSTITVNNPTITLSTCGSNTNAASFNLTLTISAAQTTATNFTDASSVVANGTVTGSGTITALATTATITVTKVSNGATSISAALPAGLGGGAATPSPCNVTFN